MNLATAAVADIVDRIDPIDALEHQHIADTLAWLASTDDVFRRVKPDTPARHLVSYVVLVDPRTRGVLLGRHRLAGLWLPTGGHIAPGEHPLAAAAREATEELGIDPEFTVAGTEPLFLTVTTTVGMDSGHQDVSLWYVIRGDRTREYTLDPGEFSDAHWWDIDTFDHPDSDPHFARFLAKLEPLLAEPIRDR
ncbi:NUDIX domain-containing protein [Nocardia sp. NBC_00565]|uniref:NUDIX domain-containing protein n=1 Tax=Nocardia sp. NBC_00565 TaxID=2975993 RepID=UPI002E803D3F|nr:NUDIX domain-containing protein [Nocardia sp. NBC_00565]WUC04244.1 NUDIX domain-containing protein [Nocardia sp. NBC_00565]